MTPSSRRLVCSVLAVTVVVGFRSRWLVAPTRAGHARCGLGRQIGQRHVGRHRVPAPLRAANDVTLTIRDDGSFDVVSKKILGASRGKGHIVISDGRLVFEGERGLRGVGTVLRNPAGDVLMKIEGTLADNSTLSATLWPTH